MRLAAAPIILLNVCLFLSGQIQALEDNYFDFNGGWLVMIETLNEERLACDDFALDPSIDLFELNKQELKHLGRQSTSNGVERMNKAMLESLHSPPAKTAPVTQDVRQIASNVLGDINANPIMSPMNIDRFANGEQIGFCFGRALAVHYLLIKAGVRTCDIYKMFALGDLMVNGQIWGFHVAIVVHDDDNGFVVIDPSFGELLTVDDWMKKVAMYDIKYPRPQTRFYVTDPRKFVPSSGIYDVETIGNPVLREYFMHLGKCLVAR